MTRKPMILLAVVSGVCATLVIDRLNAQPEPAAVQAAATRVAVCDVVAILGKYERVKDVRKTFEARVAEIEAQRKAKNKQIDSDRKFLRDEFEPGTPAYEKQLTKIREETIRLRVWEEMQAQANKREQYLTTLRLQKEVLAQVGVEAKARGIDIVLHNPLTPEPAGTRTARDPLRIHALLYATKETDLTEIVLKKLNDQYAKARGK